MEGEGGGYNTSPGLQRDTEAFHGQTTRGFRHRGLSLSSELVRVGAGVITVAGRDPTESFASTRWQGRDRRRSLGLRVVSRLPTSGAYFLTYCRGPRGRDLGCMNITVIKNVSRE